MNNLFKRFKRDILGLGWFALALFTGLALWSYRPTDPSLNSIGKNLVAANYCGYFGSFLADLLYQAFGFGSWLLVSAAARMSLRCFVGKQVQLSRLRILLASMLVVNVASLGALYFPQARVFDGQIQVGGELGRMVSKGLVSVFNSIGVAVILWTMLLALVVFYTEKPLAEIFQWPLRRFANFKSDGLLWWKTRRHWLLEKLQLPRLASRQAATVNGFSVPAPREPEKEETPSGPRRFFFSGKKQPKKNHPRSYH